MSQPESELPAAQPMAPLEERIARLEMAVAELQQSPAHSQVTTPETPQSNQGTQSIDGRQTNQGDSLPAIAIPLGVSALPAGPAAKRRLGNVLWLLVDLYREAMTIFRMFVDIRHKVAWSTRVLTIILVAAILTSQWWNPLSYLWPVGSVLDKLTVLLLAFILYKALSREAHRYLETQNAP
jgi:hypothetical protein